MRQLKEHAGALDTPLLLPTVEPVGDKAPRNADERLLVHLCTLEGSARALSLCFHLVIGVTGDPHNSRARTAYSGAHMLVAWKCAAQYNQEDEVACARS